MMRTLLPPCVAGFLAFGALAAPLAFGATEVRTYCALQILVAIAAVLWSLSSEKTGMRRVWFPLAVGGLGLIQVVPLPATQLRWLAPFTAEARNSVTELTGAPPAQGGATVDSAVTLAALRRCVAPALVIVMAAGLSRSERLRTTLVSAVALAGALMLVLGLVVGRGPGGKALGIHDMAGYWKVYKNPLLTGFHSEGAGAADPVDVGGIRYVSNSPICGSPLGAFINANHFAACIGMTAPLVVCLLAGGLPGFVRDRRLCRLLPGGYAALATYAVAVPAHARAGVAAMLLSGVAIAGMSAARTRGRALLVAAAVLVLIAGAALFANRMGLGGRFYAWLAALRMFRSSPWLGVGLGNFGNVYPVLRQGPVAYFAHSAWLEWVAESGLAGVVLLAIGIALGVNAAGRIWEWNLPGRNRLVRLGLLGGILFAALHGAVDHSVQIPANAFLCALLIGILLGDIESDRTVAAATGAAVRTVGPDWSTGFARVFVIGLAAVVAWGAWRETVADGLVLPLRRAIARQRVPLDERRLDEKPELLQAALPDAERAFAMRPRNAAFAEAIGQAFLHLSRGEDSPELHAAEDWFRRSLRLCPVHAWIPTTLREIRAKIQERSG